MTDGKRQTRPTVAVWAQLALVLLATALVALWGVFLVYLQVGGYAVPVSLLLAVVAALLCRHGGVLLGHRAGAVVPAALWLAVVLLLGAGRREGDRLIGGDSVVGLLFLVLGTVAVSVAVGTWRPPPDGQPDLVAGHGPTPATRGGRHTGRDPG